jgi:hypothetical protein
VEAFAELCLATRPQDHLYYPSFCRFYIAYPQAGGQGTRFGSAKIVTKPLNEKLKIKIPYLSVLFLPNIMSFSTFERIFFEPMPEEILMNGASQQ